MAALVGADWRASKIKPQKMTPPPKALAYVAS
jgi:hypothetical protein